MVQSLWGDTAMANDAGDVRAAVARETVRQALFGSETPAIQIGRYIVLGTLGAGGMGIVFAAHDPELDRKVALKLLQLDRLTSGSSERLVQEARALAKLSHPNVVAVHDVGRLAGADGAENVFIAMEYVDGQTLRRWWLESQRSWTEIVDVMVAAGRGLAAAHACGLIHRDFKPDNVMVGRDGRVRVLDFGLVRVDPHARDATPTENGSQPLGSSHQTLTSAGAAVGTPKYMAPEQWDGHADIDARADVFSYCVTFWEALFGAPPFDGIAALHVQDAAAKPLASRDRSRRVPRWLVAILRRGFAANPSHRFADMPELLTAVARARRSATFRRGLAAAAGIGVAVGVQQLYGAFDARQRTRACEAEGDAIAEVWNDDVSKGIHDRFATNDRAHVRATGDKVVSLLAEVAEKWRAARTESCVRTSVQKVWDGDTVERARWCLDERRLEIEAAVAALAGGGDGVALRAVEMIASLPLASPCLDDGVLQRLPLPTPEARDQLSEAHSALASASALGTLADYERGVEAANHGLALAVSANWPPTIATAQLRLGRLHQVQGDYAAAKAVLVPAYFDAAKAGAMPVAAEIADLLALIVGFDLADVEGGTAWSKHAEVAALDLPDPTGLREAYHLIGVAQIHNRAGEYSAMMAAFERALSLREAALGPEHLQVAKTLWGVANAQTSLGQLEEAETSFRRALRLREAALGPEHPDVAHGLTGLATVLERRAKMDEARALLERALDLRTRGLGDTHPETISALYNLAVADLTRGDFASARRQFAQALAWREAQLGSDHPEVAMIYNGLGVADFELGRLLDARRAHERAIAIIERVHGTDHAELVSPLNSLAQDLLAMGEQSAALTTAMRGVAVVEAALGPDHPEMVTLLTTLGSARQSSGDYEGARTALRRALTLSDATFGPTHPGSLPARINLASVTAKLNELTEAKAILRDALTLAETSLGPDHVDASFVFEHLAEVERMSGEYASATTHGRRALELREKHRGAEHSSVASVLLGLADAAIGQARPHEAIALAERAIAIYGRTGGTTAELAEAQFELARARWDAQPSGHAAARALAAAAQKRLGEPRGPDAILSKRIADWLQTHR